MTKEEAIAYVQEYMNGVLDDDYPDAINDLYIILMDDFSEETIDEILQDYV